MLGVSAGATSEQVRDAFHALSRKFHPDDDELFTWWAPWRSNRERNIGWRLDYVLASESLAARATASRVGREVGTSDHGPVMVETGDQPSA